MDPTRFDRLARALAAAPSRRGLVAAFLVSLAPAADAALANKDAGGRDGGKEHGRNRPHRHRPGKHKDRNRGKDHGGRGDDPCTGEFDTPCGNGLCCTNNDQCCGDHCCGQLAVCCATGTGQNGCCDPAHASCCPPGQGPASGGEAGCCASDTYCVDSGKGNNGCCPTGGELCASGECCGPFLDGVLYQCCGGERGQCCIEMHGNGELGGQCCTDGSCCPIKRGGCCGGTCCREDQTCQNNVCTDF